jgi:hypothetical protein
MQAEGSKEREMRGTLVLLVKNGVRTCFHIANICSGSKQSCEHIHNRDATDTCAQAVLYRSRPGNPHLFFAVFDESTQVVYFYLLDLCRERV